MLSLISILCLRYVNSLKTLGYNQPQGIHLETCTTVSPIHRIIDTDMPPQFAGSLSISIDTDKIDILALDSHLSSE